MFFMFFRLAYVFVRFQVFRFSGFQVCMCAFGVFRFLYFQVFRFACVCFGFSGFHVFSGFQVCIHILGWVFSGFQVFRFSGLPVRCLGFQACSSSGFLVCMCLFVVFRFSCLRAGFQVLRVFQVFRFSLLHGFEGCILHVELLGRQADLVCN